MSTTLFLVMALVETAFIGGLFLLYPRFARRGLLFGVYVGEDVSSGPEANAMPGSRLKAQGPTGLMARLEARRARCGGALSPSEVAEGPQPARKP